MALEAAYAFDDVGSTTVTDFSGNGRHIDLTGSDGAQVAGGDPGGALGKTGATMPVLPASVLAASQTDDRTLMFDALSVQTVWWVRWEKDAISSGTWGILSIDGTAMLGQVRRASDDALATRPSAAPPEALVWHNYCMTYVRATGVIAFYRDGALVDTESFAAGTQLTLNADRINLAEWSTTGPTIDNLRIYSHALDDAAVAATAGTPVGTTEVTGTAVANLGNVTATGLGTREVTASAVVSLGTLTATVVGTRTAIGSAVGALGGLTATVAGARTVVATAVAPLGPPVATIVGNRDVVGVAVAALGGLTAHARSTSVLPVERIRVSGREPDRTVSGREPRRFI